MSTGDVIYKRINPNNVRDVVGGRLDLVSATSIRWGFQENNQIRLFNPNTSKWEIVS